MKHIVEVRDDGSVSVVPVSEHETDGMEIEGYIGPLDKIVLLFAGLPDVFPDNPRIRFSCKLETVVPHGDETCERL